MQRSASLVLWRLLPPFRKTLDVRRVTVGGFLELVRAFAGRVSGIRERLGRDLAEADILAAIGEGELCLFADLVCDGQRQRFFSRWLGGYLMGPFTRRNIRGLMEASRMAEGDGGWTRILESIKPPEDRKPGDRGGIMADLVTISKLMSLNPLEIRDEWSMQDYIIMCESLNIMARAEDEDHERVASAGQLSMIAGIGITH